jgi:hypothetical protein
MRKPLPPRPVVGGGQRFASQTFKSRLRKGPLLEVEVDANRRADLECYLANNGLDNAGEDARLPTPSWQPSVRNNCAGDEIRKAPTVTSARPFTVFELETASLKAGCKVNHIRRLLSVTCRRPTANGQLPWTRS